ncbi:MAG: gamma-glutamyltransferase [Armatimonadetes bacterium]|nr:gamma-glutamyltransferase [Armatimonadota bacterium]
MESPHGRRAVAYRPAALGKRGMVCSGHYLASLAGMRALLAGGNAVDAALATAAALGLVEPHMSGPGGDGFLMVYNAERRAVRCIHGAGAAPHGAQREAFLGTGIPYKGIRSVSVPGIVSGWLLAHRTYGKLDLAEVFAPAIHLAEDGFAVSPNLAAALEAEAAAGSPLCQYPPSRAIFYPTGRPPQAGEIIRNPNLGETLRRIAAEGEDWLYRGPVAEAILSLSEAGEGLFARADLARHRAAFQEPIRTSYRGLEVVEYPPPSSGHVLLQELNLLEHFDVPALGFQTAATVHVMVEAKRLAFADRERYLADPQFIRVPIQGLISKAYAAERARLIHLERALPEPGPGTPAQHEETTCLCTADQWGNAVCMLQSIQSQFGSGLVAGETGVLLNNRMTYWHLEADHPDVLQPGKCVRHTMNPVMGFAQGELVLVCGTPGADTQVQTNLQVISHIVDFGLDAQEAVEAARWRHTGDGTESEYPHRCASEVVLEARFGEEMRQGLQRRGHRVRTLAAWGAAGSAQIIRRDPSTGVWQGGSDPRRDGYALAW